MKSRRIGQSRQFDAVALPEPSDTAAPSPAETVADPPRSGRPSNQSAETLYTEQSSFSTSSVGTLPLRYLSIEGCGIPIDLANAAVDWVPLSSISLLKKVSITTPFGIDTPIPFGVYYQLLPATGNGHYTKLENEMNSKKIKVKTSPEPMSMREFSRLIRRSPSHISRVMSGKRASLTISRLMKTLGVEVA